MLHGLRTAIYHVEDLAAAKAWYARITGTAPYFDEPFYVGFDVGGYELGLLPIEDEDGRPDVTVYWGVADADAAVEHLLDQGAVVVEPVKDVGEGIRIGAVRDPLGNVFGVIYNPHFRARD